MRNRLIFKILSLTILVSIMFSFVVPCSYAQDPIKKFCRGVLNISFCFLEVPKNVRDTGKKDGLGMALSYGAIKGIFGVMSRLLVGAYEIITFPIPLPKNYEPILTDPEYFLGKPEKEATIEK